MQRQALSSLFYWCLMGVAVSSFLPSAAWAERNALFYLCDEAEPLQWAFAYRLAVLVDANQGVRVLGFHTTQRGSIPFMGRDTAWDEPRSRGGLAPENTGLAALRALAGRASAAVIQAGVLSSEGVLMGWAYVLDPQSPVGWLQSVKYKEDWVNQFGAADLELKFPPDEWGRGSKVTDAEVFASGILMVERSLAEIVIGRVAGGDRAAREGGVSLSVEDSRPVAAAGGHTPKMEAYAAFGQAQQHRLPEERIAALVRATGLDPEFPEAWLALALEGTDETMRRDAALRFLQLKPDFHATDELLERVKGP